MTSPRTLRVFSWHRSAGDDRSVRDHVREALVTGPLQRLAQVRCLLGQHRDDLVRVPVGGGPGDAVIAGQGVGGGRGRGTTAARAPPARSRSAPGCPGASRGGARSPAAPR